MPKFVYQKPLQPLGIGSYSAFIGTAQDDNGHGTHVAGAIAVIVAACNEATLEVSQKVPAAYPEVIAIASNTAKAGTNIPRRRALTLTAISAASSARTRHPISPRMERSIPPPASASVFPPRERLRKISPSRALWSPSESCPPNLVAARPACQAPAWRARTPPAWRPWSGRKRWFLDKPRVRVRPVATLPSQPAASGLAGWQHVG